jgi:hypothetical protein
VLDDLLIAFLDLPGDAWSNIVVALRGELFDGREGSGSGRQAGSGDGRSARLPCPAEQVGPLSKHSSETGFLVCSRARRETRDPKMDR